MKAKSFYKNNKHNNMDSKEKENINEEELKAQDAQDETCEETTEKEEGANPRLTMILASISVTPENMARPEYPRPCVTIRATFSIPRLQ